MSNLMLASTGWTILFTIGGLIVAAGALFWFWPKLKRGFQKHRP